MGEMREKTTIRTLCEMTGTNPDTMRMRFTKLREKNPTLFPFAWRIDSELSQAQITELLKAGDRKGGAPRQDTSEAFLNCTDDSAPAAGLPNEAAPAGGFLSTLHKKTLIEKLIAIEWRVQIFVLFAFCLVVGHAGFIWWDLSRLWGMAGTIGGCFVFVFILSGMVLMSEKSERMKEVRENMLWAVTSLEALAIVVHRATFYRDAGEAYVAGLGVGYTWAIAAVICCVSIGTTVFYQKVVSK